MALPTPPPPDSDDERPDEHQTFASETARIELDALWAMLGRAPPAPKRKPPDEPKPDDDSR